MTKTYAYLPLAIKRAEMKALCKTFGVNRLRVFRLGVAGRLESRASSRMGLVPIRLAEG